jgi:hypothetical protein
MNKVTLPSFGLRQYIGADVLLYIRQYYWRCEYSYNRETWPESLSYSRGPRNYLARPGIETGPPAWEASTLEKSHPVSLLFAVRNICIWIDMDWRGKMVKTW